MFKHKRYSKSITVKGRYCDACELFYPSSVTGYITECPDCSRPLLKKTTGILGGHLKKKKKRSNLRIKISKLDKLFSYYIRLRDGFRCNRCKKQYHHPTSGLHCSHFHGRRKQSVRFDPDNAISFDFGCHRWMEENPAEHVEWFKKRLGKARYDALLVRANTPGRPDHEAIERWLNAEIKKLEKSEGG